MIKAGETSLDADSRVVENPERPAAVSWPLPVDAWLERLVEQAKDAGERTSRKELVAALVASSKPSDAQLGKILRRYRTMKVREILPVPEGENVVPFTKQPPGPRTRSRSRSR